MIGTNLAITTKNYAVAGSAVVYDTDAQAYFTANTAITSDADKNAINDFYLGLKSDNIYTKITAMYLPLWSSSTNNKWNLKNPLDTNAAYRLTFSTGWTHSSSGMTPTNAFANTFYTPSVNGQLNSAHLSFYSRTDSNLNQIDIGSQTASNYQILQLRVSNLYYALINQSGLTSGANLSSTGFYVGNRQLSNDIDLWKNGTKVTNGTTASGTRPTNSIYIGANNTGSAGTFSTKQCSFATIGDGMTDTEATNFYTRVNTLMTYFGINV